MKLYSTRSIALCTLFLSVISLITLVGVSASAFASDAEELKHIQQAKDYRDAGKLKHAVIELKNALKINPTNPKVRLLLGQIYIELGKGEYAEKELRRARGAELDPGVIIVSLGEALLLQSKFDEVIDEITVSPGLSTDQLTQIYIMHGEAYLGSLKQEEAAKAFQVALQVSPTNERALLGQARLAMIQGEFADAHKHIKRALESDPMDARGWRILGDLEQSQDKYQEAERAYSKAIQHSDRHSAVQLKRALVRIEQKNYKGADSDIQAVKNVAKDVPDVNYAEGLLNFRQEKFAKAQEYFQKVLIVSPGHLESIYYSGASQFALNNFEQAEQHLSRFLAVVPQSDDAAKLLGITRLKLKDYTGADAVLTQAVARKPNDVALLRALGKALLAQGKSEKGNKYLQQAVALLPGSATERLELAVNHLRLGERERGLEELQKATELDPSLLIAEKLIITEQLKAKKIDVALKAAEQLRKKWPIDPDPVTLMGLAYTGKGEISKARAAFEQALQMQPGNPNAANNLAALEIQAGNIDNARSYYKQILKYNPGHEAAILKLASLEDDQGNRQASHRWLEEAIRANPESLEPRLAMAQSELKEGKPLNALATLREIQNRHGNNPMYLVSLGEAQMDAGQAASAVRNFRKLVEKQPKSADAHYILGRAFLVHKDWVAAREVLFKGLALGPAQDSLLASRLMTDLVATASNLEEKNKLVGELKRVQPDHLQVLDLQAQLVMKQGKPEKAVAIYTDLQKRFPDESVWVLQLAKAQWQADQRDDHMATLTKWLKEHPEDVRAEYMRANSYLRLNKLDGAKTSFTKVIEKAPNNTSALNNLALLLREQDPQLALTYAEKALKLSPDNPAMMDTLGIILLQQDKTKQALKLLDRAANKSPDLLTIHYHKAMALAKIGETDQARKILKKLAGADFPESAEAHALLIDLGG